MAKGTCSSCRHSRHPRAQGQADLTRLECWRFPPTGHPIMAQNTTGRPMLAGAFAIYPTIEPTWTCGEHAPKPEAMQ